MKKTIKELADELGVTKQAVRKHLDKLPPTLSVTKEKGIIQLNADVVDFVKGRVTVVTSEVDTEVAGNVTSVVDSHLLDRINFLEEQILSKDNQLETKDQQLTQVHKLLDQQQVLTLQANKKIAELETTLNVEEENVTSKESSDDIKKEGNEPGKKSFFARLFGR